MPQAAVSASPFPVSEKAHADLPVLLLPPPPHLPSLKTLDRNLLSGVEKGKSMFFHCLSQWRQSTFGSVIYVRCPFVVAPEAFPAPADFIFFNNAFFLSIKSYMFIIKNREN